MFIKLLILFFLCNFIAFTVGGMSQVVNKEKYKEKLIEGIVKELEKKGITGNGFIMNDFTTNITKEYYGHFYDGNCTFYDGFVSRIEEITGPAYESHLSYDNINNTHVTLEFNIILKKLRTFYNLDCAFTDLQFTGNIELLFNEVTFSVSLIRNLETKEILESIKYYSVAGDYETGVRGYPYHEHMQAVASLKAKYKFTIADSFKEWNPTFSDFLAVAVNKTQFPEICYNC